MLKYYELLIKEIKKVKAIKITLNILRVRAKCGVKFYRFNKNGSYRDYTR